jgi:hypothetical protein
MFSTIFSKQTIKIKNGNWFEAEFARSKALRSVKTLIAHPGPLHTEKFAKHFENPFSSQSYTTLKVYKSDTCCNDDLFVIIDAVLLNHDDILQFLM